MMSRLHLGVVFCPAHADHRHRSPLGRCVLRINRIIIAEIPIENHSEPGQSAEMPLKTIGKSANFGDYNAIRSSHTANDSQLLYRHGGQGASGNGWANF
jgi:hypothetical protein